MTAPIVWFVIRPLACHPGPKHLFIMRLNSSSTTVVARVAPVVMAALLFVQCSSDGTDTRDTSLGAGTLNDQQRADSIRTSKGETRNADGTWSSASATTDRAWATDNTTNEYLYPANRPVPATAAEERAMANSDMRGLRAILLADLEMVRARLNDGTRTNDQKATDQALAGDLAQGLERVDRALVAMDATTDATWSTMRAAQLKEVEEVRTWMVGYREKGQVRS